MALSQLRPMVIEGDRLTPAPAGGMVKMADGSLIMRGAPKRAIEQPGMLSGLLGWAKSKLSPAPAEPAPFWIPQPAAPVAAPAPVPVSVGPGAPLPGYNDAAWNEIAEKTAEQERVARELAQVSKNVMGNERLIQGKYFSTNAPKRVD